MIEIADRIICPSRYEYDNFARYFPAFCEKTVVIENTVETFLPQKEILDKIRSEYAIKREDVISTYVGRLEKIKGAHILLHSIPGILKRHKNLKIFVIGKSLERDIYTQLKKTKRSFPKQIFYIKYLPKNVLFQYYYLSDIYISTSLSESFSLSTHESALCNNALLLNRLSVFEKFKEAALFFSDYDNNGEGFVHQYECLIKNKKLRKILARRAAIIMKDFVNKNRLKKDFTNLFKSF